MVCRLSYIRSTLDPRRLWWKPNLTYLLDGKTRNSNASSLAYAFLKCFAIDPLSPWFTSIQFSCLAQVLGFDSFPMAAFNALQEFPFSSRRPSILKTIRIIITHVSSSPPSSLSFAIIESPIHNLFRYRLCEQANAPFPFSISSPTPFKLCPSRISWFKLAIQPLYPTPVSCLSQVSSK